jgi:hypothetical protein
MLLFAEKKKKIKKFNHYILSTVENKWKKTWYMKKFYF